jgi:predicted nucleic acid-binding Zn ribbon protein
MSPRREDPRARDRRAGSVDRDGSVYARRRARAAADRAERSEVAPDLVPPTDEDWTDDDADAPTLRRLDAPTTLAAELAALVARRGWSERLGAASVRDRWEDIVGADLARVCEPVRLAGGVLQVRVIDQVWATQLRYLLDRVRSNVNQALGRAAVERVTMVVGPLEGPPPDDAQPEGDTGREPPGPSSEGPGRGGDRREGGAVRGDRPDDGA